MKTFGKYIIIIAAIFISSFSTFAQAHNSTEAHSSKVNAIAAAEENVYFSAGQDGYLIRWDTDGIGSHYQVSEFPIRKISVSPNNNYIAIYESNGTNIHRVSLWNWKKLTRVYAKRFADEVTAINFSAKGTYLLIGTSAINGIFILNATDGTVVAKPENMPAMVSFIKTSNTEKSAVMYSPNGSLVYYSIARNQEIQKLNTEKNLEQPIIFGTGKFENCYLAGTKNNNLYLNYAPTGNKIGVYPARNALIFTSSSVDEKGLYYTTFDGKNYLLNLLTNEQLANQIQADTSKINNPPACNIVKKFSGVSNDSYLVAAKSYSEIAIGSSQGNIYKMNSIPESEMLSMYPISSKEYEHIYDIATFGNMFYFNTKNAVYKSNYENDTIQQIGENTGYTNIIPNSDGVILWSKGTKKSVIFENTSTKAKTTLFTPENILQNLRRFGNKLVAICGNSSVSIFDFASKKYTTVYTGTAIQDAILYNEKDMYIGKTNAGNSTPLVYVDITTKENVTLANSATVLYSLNFDYSKPGSDIYGISISYQDSKPFTKVFSYSPDKKEMISLLQYPAEDANATVETNFPYIFTNIGLSNFRSYNSETSKQFVYDRSASIPVKMKVNNNVVAILNKDGSISWYDVDDATVLSDWYLKTTGEWWKF